MSDITKPLRLSRGSHNEGKGRGCIMNVISWELGENPISDHPAGVARTLARFGHWANDSCCLENASSKLICAGHSDALLTQGHRTIGSAAVESHGVWMAVGKRLGLSSIVHQVGAACGCGCSDLFMVDYSDQLRRIIGSSIVVPISAWAQVIDAFEAVTGWKASPTPSEVTKAAVDRMLYGRTLLPA